MTEEESSNEIINNENSEHDTNESESQDNNAVVESGENNPNENYLESQAPKFNTMPAFATGPDSTKFKVINSTATALLGENSNDKTSSMKVSDSLFSPTPPDVYSKTQISPRSPRSSRSSRSSKNATLFSTTTQSSNPLSLKEKAMKLEPLYNLTNEQYESLLAELVEDRRRLATSHQFKESANITNVLRHVEACQIQQQKYELQVEAVQEYDIQVEKFRKEIADFDRETDEMEQELKGKLARQRERILQSHQRELDAHVQKWSQESMKRQYNHASFQLRTLQKQFRLLMLECRFQEAEELKSVIDKKAKSEQQDAVKQMQHDFEVSTNKLKQKMDSEMTSYEQRAQIQIKSLQQKRSWLRLSFMNKQKKIEQMASHVSDREKLWNTKQLQRKEELARGRSLTTPNTSSRLNEEDVIDREHPTLQLPPLRVPLSMTKTNR